MGVEKLVKSSFGTEKVLHQNYWLTTSSATSHYLSVHLYSRKRESNTSYRNCTGKVVGLTDGRHKISYSGSMLPFRLNERSDDSVLVLSKFPRIDANMKTC